MAALLIVGAAIALFVTGHYIIGGILIPALFCPLDF